MKLNTYLTFSGQCEAAFRFYEKALGGRIVALFPFAGTPAEGHVAPEWRNKVMHAALAVGDDVLMGSDGPSDKPINAEGFSVSIQIADSADAERIFAALSENGQVTMPMEETFWALRFGMCTDQFGVPWMVNCSKPMA